MTASSGMSGDLMRRFCETKGYAELATMDSAGAYMHVNGPMGLAAFVAYCSGNRRIYLRGSTIDHPYSVPTLFRRDGDGRQYDYPECKRRWYAYRDLLIRLRSILSDRRWHRPRLGAVLQHYGLKTPWFDVVRNFYTAIWFATRDEAGGTAHSPFGWISLYANRRKELRVIDLWGMHSSKHFRPHMQQGLSLAMQPDPDPGPPAGDTQHPCRQQDFNEYRIAQICFRKSAEWDLDGHMFSWQFLCPCQGHDDSFRQLSNSAVKDAVVAACKSQKLDHIALGRVGGCPE